MAPRQVLCCDTAGASVTLNGKDVIAAQAIILPGIFQKAKREYNLGAYLACLSEKGQFMFGGSIMVSKKELKKRLSPFWADRRTSHINTRPSFREELNGNFFDGIFYNLVITVKNDKAKPIVIFVTPNYTVENKIIPRFSKT